MNHYDIKASTSKFSSCKLAIIVAMTMRSEVRAMVRWRRERPAVALQKNQPRLKVLSGFAHLRRRERNTRGERTISRTYRFICCPQPCGRAAGPADSRSRTHQGCTTSYFKTSRQKKEKKNGRKKKEKRLQEHLQSHVSPGAAK